ncbi:MAG: hypothetical protein CMG60_05775 [Candidatus Marinimicrobia bacterium]|nr:hypothetical protein [Candidatus Neomarinimicrobiota bacterium]
MLIKNKNSFIIFVVALVTGLILLNLTSRDIFHRFDLTDNKKFSLSNSSESIVSKLDDLLTIKVYFSDDLPNELGNTRRYLQDILEEYRALSKNVKFFFHDPESDAELEEKARKDGIQPVQMQALENDQMVVKKVYLGMVLLFENKKEIIPLIQTTAGLEYMISTKIKSLINIDKKTVGLMHLSNVEQPKTENLTTQLNQHYNFRSIDPKNPIPGNINVLLVTGTTDSINEKTLDNLNQYLRSGNRMLFTQSGVNTDIQTQQANPIESNVFDFLKKYRLDLQKNLVLDSKCGNVQVRQSVGLFSMNRAVQYPFFPIVDSFNIYDTLSNIIVNNLEQVLPLFPSEIIIDTLQNDEVKNVVHLFKSSNNSGKMESNFMLSPDPQQNPFLKMLGQDGKILAASSRLSNNGELMLLSDSKFLSDEGGMSIPDNVVFLMNAVDYLAGDKDLISLRSREITSRPLDILQLPDNVRASMTQEEIDKEQDKIKKRWKLANLVLPSLLIIGFGIFRMKKEKEQAEVLKQIYD